MRHPPDVAPSLGPVGVDQRLADSRAGLLRLTPRQAHAASLAGALLVDTRTEAQRRRQGELPGAIVIDRTVLEWRLDPDGQDRIPEASSDATVIVICRQGYSSSLAAASLQHIGIRGATDMIGGVEAWIDDGLPVHRGAADVRE